MMELRGKVSTREELEVEVKKLREKVTGLLIDQELILKEFEPLEPTFGAKIDAHTDELIKKQFIKEMFKGDAKKFYQALADGGISQKKFREQQRKNVVVEMMRSQYAKPEAEYITEEEKAAWLRKNSQRFRTDPKVKLWSITIPGITADKAPKDQMALAKEIRTSLLNGADFSALARTHSTDSVRDEGGSRGWWDKSTCPVPKLWPVLSTISAGKFSDVIPYEGNLFIFWVESREEGKMPPKADVDQAVERGIMTEKRQKAADKWLALLHRKAVIRKP